MKFEDFFLKIKEYNFKQYSTLAQADQYKYLFNILKNEKGDNSISLDWGGGQGHMSAMLVSLGYKNTLLSIADYIDKWTEINKKIKFEWKHFDESVIKIPFNDKTFTHVISCGVLEHVKETGGDDIESLKEIHRVLKNNGKFIVYHLPNKFSWIEFLSSFYKKDSHEFKYSYKSFKKILNNSKTNLKIQKHFRYGILPRRSARNIKNIFFRVIYNLIDKVLEKTPLIYISQNHCFILEKIDD